MKISPPPQEDVLLYEVRLYLGHLEGFGLCHQNEVCSCSDSALDRHVTLRQTILLL